MPNVKSKKDVFISYSYKDEIIANLLRGLLLGNLIFKGFGIFDFDWENYGTRKAKNSGLKSNEKVVHWANSLSSTTMPYGFVEVKNKKDRNDFYDREKSINNVYSFLHTKSRPGEHFPSVIESQIRKSKVVVVLLSNSTLSSEWVDYEISLAKELNKIIIPVHLEKLKYCPDKLRYTQAVLAYKSKYTDCDWMRDIDFAILGYMNNYFINDQLDLDKKSGKKQSLVDRLKVEFRSTYGFDLFKIFK